jgi:hypothetical protein
LKKILSAMERRHFFRCIAGSILLPQYQLDFASANVSGDNDTDSVAIYASLLSKAGMWLEPGEQFGLSLMTFAVTAPELFVTGEAKRMHSGPLRPTITSGPDIAPTIARMVRDLVAAGKTPRPLLSGLSLPKACLLLTPEEIRQFDMLRPSGGVYDPT